MRERLTCSMYAEPSACPKTPILQRILRSSPDLRPSRRRPWSDSNSYAAIKKKLEMEGLVEKNRREAGVGPGCWLLRGCERLGPFNSYKIATERHLMFKICLITNFESLISFLALNSCKKVHLNIFGVYFCMSMSPTAPWAHPCREEIARLFTSASIDHSC